MINDNDNDNGDNVEQLVFGWTWIAINYPLILKNIFFNLRYIWGDSRSIVNYHYNVTTIFQAVTR